MSDYQRQQEAGPDSGIRERREMPAEQQWNLEEVYSSAEQWEADFRRLDQLAAPLEQLKGSLDRAAAVADFFRQEADLDRLAEKLYVYAHLKADEDTADSPNQGRQTRMRGKLAELAGRLAWAVPEILAQPHGVLCEWTGSEALREFRQRMTKLVRRKAHTLSEPEETLLSKAGEIFAAPQQAFSMLTNADMRFPQVKGEDGQLRDLSQGRYITFLISPQRRVRTEAFAAMYDTYGSFRNTLASTLSHTVKTHNYHAQVRHYGSALEAALADDHIPTSLYDSLIAATHQALPAFHDYVALRRDQLGLADLDMCDMYVPIVPDCQIRVPFEQARQWVLDACRPLGQEYCRILESAFADRWIDIYENRGKRSGAYSSGCYDSFPYILLNYQGTLDDVFTLAHELGHSMHTHLANHAQPYHTASYPIFIAEIASTTNEALLLHHLLQTRTEPSFRAYLLNHLCDAFKGTVYRQTMFAEFEKLIHETDASGQPLTPDALGQAYYDLNARYYGPEVSADRRIGLEWARIPHFYYNFYVYKYATSFCAAQVFYRRILESVEERDRYLGLLRAGGSADPLDLVQAAGVDLTRPQTYRDAFATFAETVQALRRQLTHPG